MKKRCLWCLKSEPETSFQKKAHTIPKSLGGENFNNNVCDECNEFFGNRNCSNRKYSIEEALKETFNITRKRLSDSHEPKKKIGRFKSKFFEVKIKNGKYRLDLKTSFKFSQEFQVELCRAFKRGLYKMFLEEINRQQNIGYEEKYDIIRKFARYNENDLPIFYFVRKFGAIILTDKEIATPILMFDRMKYLYSNEKFVEIEFLGHVFGFPISPFTSEDLIDYKLKSFNSKSEFFTNAIEIYRLIDVDITLNILNS